MPPFDARGAMADPPLLPPARWEARRAITFDREIRGFRPAKGRCRITVSPSLDGPAAGRVLFFTGVGIPEGRSSGRLKTPPPGRGEKGPEGLAAAGLFVIIERASGVPG